MNDHPVGGFSALAAIRRQRWLALAVFTGVLLAVLTWLGFAARSYTASATITATPSADLLQSTGNFEDLETTLAQLANSQSVLMGVTGRLGGERTVDQLRNQVHGTHVTGTVLIRITVRDAKPAAAAYIANAVATELPLHDPSGGMFTFTQSDPARPPSTYSSPDTKIGTLAGIALAILLALGAALLYDTLVGTVDTADQLKAAAGTDLLATLRRPKDLSELSVWNGEASVASGLRSLRLAVESTSVDRDTPIGPIVVATLSRDRRLGAWLACNIAAAFAQAHHSVLLVDGELGESTAHPALDGHGSAGLYGVLREDASIEQASRSGPIDGLTILPAGDAAPGSMNGLVERRLPKLLAEVDGAFDVVVVLAPTNLDSALAMASGNSVLLAVPARRVRIATLRRLVGELNSNGAHILGAALIRKPPVQAADLRRFAGALEWNRVSQLRQALMRHD